jgi:hypothetical protein
MVVKVQRKRVVVRSASRSIHRTAVRTPEPGGGEEPMGIFYRLARRWLGLTKIAIAIEKKVAKQASAYHLS